MADYRDPENTLLIETTKGPVVIEMRPDLVQFNPSARRLALRRHIVQPEH